MSKYRTNPTKGISHEWRDLPSLQRRTRLRLSSSLCWTCNEMDCSSWSFDRHLCYLQTVTGFWPHFPILSFPSNVQSLSLFAKFRGSTVNDIQAERLETCWQPCKTGSSAATPSSMCDRACATNPSHEAQRPRLSCMSRLCYRASPTAQVPQTR
jgi:hypothetical protein